MTISRDSDSIDALRRSSAGRLTRGEAIRILRRRDGAGLIVALGDAGFPLPAQVRAVAAADAETFDTIWNAPQRP
jgi:hypothetical protein